MLTKFFLKNQITLLFVLFVVLTGGIVSLLKLGKLEDPDFTIKTALVVTIYPGASPYEVEQEVTRKIEEACQSASMVEKIRSKSRANMSMVYVDLYESVKASEIDQLWDILRRKVEAVQADLPKDVLKSVVYDDYSDVFGIFLAVTGKEMDAYQLERYAKFLKKELLLVKNVEKINLFGGSNKAIYIELDPVKAKELNIHPQQIINAVNSSNFVFTGGAVETDVKRIRVSGSSHFKSREEIGEVLILCGKDKFVRLKDIAEIKREPESPMPPFMRYNSKPSIGIAVSAKQNANVVEMGEAVNKKLETLLSNLPSGIKIEGIYYQSDFVKDSIKKFGKNLGQSVFIVTLVLFFSMGLRSGLIIASNLILSIAATFCAMLAMGINLHQISIAALILVMGMIVDNAIVVAEGVQTNINIKADKFTSCLHSAGKNAFPLLGATIIASLAFMPIYLAPTNMGEYVGSLFLVVAVSLIFSWVFAMTQTPLFSLYLLHPKKGHKENYSGFVYDFYRKVLGISFRYKKLTLFFMIFMLAAGVFGFFKVPKNFFADSEKAQFFVDYRRPEGTKIEAVSKDIKIFESWLLKKSGVKNITSSIGQGVPRFAASITPRSLNRSFAQVVVNVDDHKKIDEMIKEIKSWFKKNLPQGEAHLWKYISGPNGKYRIEARFTGPDPLVLRRLAKKAREIMHKNKFTDSVTDDWREKEMVYNLKYSPLKAKIAGVEKQHFAAALLCATDGLPITQFRENNEVLNIRLRYKNVSPENISSVPVFGSFGKSIPILQASEEISHKFEDPVVRRYNRTRVIRAQCDPIPGVTADSVLKQIRPEIEKIKLPKGYELDWGGENERSQIANKGVRQNIFSCVLFMVIILVFLFNSVKQTFIVILTIPFAITGIAAGLLLSGQPFGFLPIIGFYSLMGMLIKNAIVLIDEINIEIREGKQPFFAVKNASVNRLRPVILTSVTTILGMTPLLQDALFTSMAVTIMSGLFFGAVLTLVLVPVLYLLFYGIKYEKAS